MSYPLPWSPRRCPQPPTLTVFPVALRHNNRSRCRSGPAHGLLEICCSGLRGPRAPFEVISLRDTGCRARFCPQPADPFQVRIAARRRHADGQRIRLRQANGNRPKRASSWPSSSSREFAGGLHTTERIAVVNRRARRHRVCRRLSNPKRRA